MPEYTLYIQEQDMINGYGETYKYRSILRDENEDWVDTIYTRTVWGAKRKAKKYAQKHANPPKLLDKVVKINV